MNPNNDHVLTSGPYRGYKRVWLVFRPPNCIAMPAKSPLAGGLEGHSGSILAHLRKRWYTFKSASGDTNFGM